VAKERRAKSREPGAEKSVVLQIQENYDALLSPGLWTADCGLFHQRPVTGTIRIGAIGRIVGGRLAVRGFVARDLFVAATLSLVLFRTRAAQWPTLNDAHKRTADQKGDKKNGNLTVSGHTCCLWNAKPHPPLMLSAVVNMVNAMKRGQDCSAVNRPAPFQRESQSVELIDGQGGRSLWWGRQVAVQSISRSWIEPWSSDYL